MAASLLTGLTILMIGDSHLATPDYLIGTLQDGLVQQGAKSHRNARLVDEHLGESCCARSCWHCYHRMMALNLRDPSNVGSLRLRIGYLQT